MSLAIRIREPADLLHSAADPDRDRKLGESFNVPAALLGNFDRTGRS